MLTGDGNQVNGTNPSSLKPNGTMSSEGKNRNKGIKKSSNGVASPEVNNLRNEKELSAVKPPEGFMPYGNDEITPELAALAALNLNETDETRAEGLKQMREILRNDPDLVFTDTDKFLLVFLRSRKFDAKRSAEFLKLGLHYVESYLHLLERKDPEIIRRVIRQNLVGFLPYRDAKGRAIIYARADTWDHHAISAADTIFGGIVAVQSAAHNPVNQITGFIVLLDLKDLKIQQVLAMSRWMIFGTITLQRACPCFMKAFHVINVPPIYKIGWKLVKPLLSEKIRKRFIFHKSSDLSTLYEHLPQEILPPELGGPIPFSNEHWAQDIDGIERDYYAYLNNNYFMSKRKKAAPANLSTEDSKPSETLQSDKSGDHCQAEYVVG